MLTIIDILKVPIIYLLETLAENITDRHKLFLMLFPDRHLTPKMHFTLHYTRIIRQFGPQRLWNSFVLIPHERHL
ncbi:hypothetical protein NPIL_612441 [Nephila pilipes]|uniref:Uncharacterized protein n=1 Tax=Nephila pilipes TaxID=299642 RepID=A0A8X6NZQ3_NEPPI|nr:hypothetical protein NPIL_612441 [Nephila pilipes]